VITPPDVLSQLVLAIPLMILFEGTLIVMRFAEKKDAAEKAKAEAEAADPAASARSAVCRYAKSVSWKVHVDRAGECVFTADHYRVPVAAKENAGAGHDAVVDWGDMNLSARGNAGEVARLIDGKRISLTRYCDGFVGGNGLARMLPEKRACAPSMLLRVASRPIGLTCRHQRG